MMNNIFSTTRSTEIREAIGDYISKCLTDDGEWIGDADVITQIIEQLSAPSETEIAQEDCRIMQERLQRLIEANKTLHAQLTKANADKEAAINAYNRRTIETHILEAQLTAEREKG